MCDKAFACARAPSAAAVQRRRCPAGIRQPSWVGMCNNRFIGCLESGDKLGCCGDPGTCSRGTFGLTPGPHAAETHQTQPPRMYWIQRSAAGARSERTGQQHQGSKQCCSREPRPAGPTTAYKVFQAHDTHSPAKLGILSRVRKRFVLPLRP